MNKSGRRWFGLGVWGIMGMSFLLNFLRIGREGFGDKYYAAAVKSMLTNWHNFFFASFDPGGFVTVDKPAPGLWIQTLSAAILGFKGWALILPQALAQALSVGILYVLVKKTHGLTAGLVSAFVLAITPISVAVSRTNQLDSLLLTPLLLATWAVMIATQRSSLKWLIAGLALLGLGFNIKMFAAYMILPAFVVLYLFGSQAKFWKKIGHLAVGAIVLAAVSLAWAAVVDLTPKDRRPFIGGSRTNSVIELAVDYNGINRLIPQWLRRGRFGFFRGARGLPRAVGGANIGPPSNVPSAGSASGGIPAQGPPMMRGGGPMGFEAGRAGLLRLFNRQMGGQASWLVIFGLIGAAVAVSKMKRPLFKEPKSQAVLLWVVWFFTLAVYFSTAGFFHRYYLNLIAPSIAALCGISVAELRQSYREKGWRGWILPLAFLAAAGVQTALLIPYPAWARWMGPLILIFGLFSFSALTIFRIIGLDSPYLPASILALGLAGLLIAPAVWSITTITHGVSASMPVAGPDLGRGPMRNPGANFTGPGFMGFNEEMNTTKLVDFLKRNRKGEKFLLAVQNARQAWDIILETGAPVMAMGGFMGDNILNVEKLDRLVKNGDVRYFLVRRMPQIPAGARPIQPGTRPALGGIFGGAGALREIDKWIEEHGTLVPDEAWKDTADLNRERPTQAAIGWLPFTNIPFSALRPGIRGSLKLYDLRPESTKS